MTAQIKPVPVTLLQGSSPAIILSVFFIFESTSVSRVEKMRHYIIGELWKEFSLQIQYYQVKLCYLLASVKMIMKSNFAPIKSHSSMVTPLPTCMFAIT